MMMLRGERHSPVPGRIGVFLFLAAGLGFLLHHYSATEDEFQPPKGPGVPNDWFYMQRAWPSGVINHEARHDAIRQTRNMRDFVGPEGRKRAAGDWELVGPTNVGGRITDIAADPNDTDTYYIAAASGGVWKTTDGGTNFTSVFDGYGSLSIGAIAVDPTNADIVYVGTGEANPGGGSVAYGGDGVWKSTDGGQTWTHLGLELTRYIGRIVVDPLTPSRVYVAATGNLFSKNADRGVYRTVDAGTTWAKVHFISDSTGCIDLAIDPSNPDRIFAAMWERIRRPDTRRYGGITSGIWRTEDGGDTWSILAGGLPLPSNLSGRIGVAVSPANTSKVYATYTDQTGFFDGFFQSTNSGSTWTQKPASGLTTFYSSFGWWFSRLWPSPDQEDVVFADGISLYKTTNGGTSFNSVGNTMHVDHHTHYISASTPNFMLNGNDGGLYVSNNGGAGWSFVNGLPISQFYTIEVNEAQPSVVYGGTQDNGTNRTPGGLLDDWEELFGGDGHYVNVGPDDTDVIYLEYQYGNFFKSTDGGNNFSSAMFGISGGDRKNWSTPVVIDPTSIGNVFTTLYYGANRLYRSENSAASWTPISGDLSDGNPGSGGVTFGTITTIAVAPSDSATIYVGTDDGNVWVSTDYGGTYTPIETGLPNRWISRIAVDPLNDGIAYVTLSGFRDDDPLSHLFRTINHGSSWTDISSNLPDAPLNDIIVDPVNPSILYVASDVGVFTTGNLGTTWALLGNNLPDGVVVTDIKYLSSPAPTLFAATYGRSCWSFDLSQATTVADGWPAGLSGETSIALFPNAPNPFRDETAIRFALPDAGHARLEVIDIAGRRVRILQSNRVAAGEHLATWDGRDEAGRAVANGVYFYRLAANGESVARKMTLSR